MPAHRHHPPLGDDSDDEDLSDEQIRHLFDQAEADRAARGPQSLALPAEEATLKFPRLNPGNIADNHLSTKGSITRFDHSKLVDDESLALANGYKKIVDPVQVAQDKQKVCSIFVFHV